MQVHMHRHTYVHTHAKYTHTNIHTNMQRHACVHTHTGEGDCGVNMKTSLDDVNTSSWKEWRNKQGKSKDEGTMS